MSNPIKAFDLIQDKSWAIHPAKLDEIDAFIQMKLNGQAYVEAAQGKSGNRAEDRYEIRDGVAIIPVYGVLARRMNMIIAFSGGTSLELLRRDIADALINPEVSGILLDIDSPGGTIDGTKETADLIFNSRSQKPIVAYAESLMASAALWIGTAAETVVISETAMAGSIGIAITHYDYSVQDAQRGIKRTVISAGKYKRIASDEKPLSKEGKAYLQDITDTYYSLFINAVALNRNTEIETVLEDMADGRDFIGQQALEAGLVDRIGNMEEALKLVKLQINGENTGNINIQEDIHMNMQEFQTKYPDLYNQAVALGRDEALEKIETAKTEARTAREKELIALARAAYGESLAANFEKMIQAGVSAEQVTALKEALPEMEKKSDKKEEILTHLKLVSSQGLEPAKAKDPEESEDFLELVEQYRLEHKCSKTEAIQAITKSHPKAHQAYLKKVQNR